MMEVERSQREWYAFLASIGYETTNSLAGGRPLERDDAVDCLQLALKAYAERHNTHVELFERLPTIRLRPLAPVPVVEKPPPPLGQMWAVVLPRVPDEWPGEPEVRSETQEPCAVCLVKGVVTVCQPCSHACLCVECARVLGAPKVVACPICRQRITCIQRIFS
jgi:hypothetical protein